jgi:glycerol uptake facilitator-like aquaporin
MNISLNRRIVAETIGTAMLLAAGVGSGIMAARLSGGNLALAFLFRWLVPSLPDTAERVVVPRSEGVAK